MKDKLIDVFLFLALIFGWIALVMGHVALLDDMRATESVAPTEETEEILRCAQDDTRDDTSSVTAAPCHLPLGGEGLRATESVAPAEETDEIIRDDQDDTKNTQDDTGTAERDVGVAAPYNTEQEELQVDWTNCFTTQDVLMYAALLEHESINCCTVQEQVAPIWLAENRVASSDPQFPDTTYGVLTQPNQFLTYYDTAFVERSTVDLVEQQLTLIAQERIYGCYPIEGRPIPREYLWYSGDKVRTNYYRTTYPDYGVYWDWSWTGGY